MESKLRTIIIPAVLIIFSLHGCKISNQTVKEVDSDMPESYADSGDSLNIARISWKEYFSDKDLIALIDTALQNNQEMNIFMQEIAQSKNEVRARKGEYLPFVDLRGGAGIEKEGRYTRHGAVDENLEIREGKAFPEPLPDYMFGLYASWELDVWKKLRNAKKAALTRYLSTIEGRNFMVTNLIAEISGSYYELIALDNLLEIVESNIAIQTNALNTIRQQMQAGEVTQLAVNRFEAQVLNTKNLQFDILQQRVETENRINFLVGRFPQRVARNPEGFKNLAIDSVYAGLPSQLLKNRPDIRQAEMDLAAARLDVKVARANFYPSFRISAGTGFQAFDPALIVNPKSIFYSLAGDLVAPLVNRNAIKAAYSSANARQVQAIYNYEQTILEAYVEVINQLSEIDNSAKSYATKAKEAEILTQSVTISNNLFRSARADYMEVLLTQREALESRVELIEIKLKQMHAHINIYHALGGGWN